MVRLYVIYRNDLFDWIKIKGVFIDIDESRSKVFKEKLVTHLKFDYLWSKYSESAKDLQYIMILVMFS